ncbi:MAG: HPF/RaiA family ribosome-associated protein [Ignavibacteria bacterium]|jgi:ribosome-associated translation inhibitor RaiA|nr:HPF/RaiA family ribosome-associated protein [Ignavibacteria bacterium]
MKIQINTDKNISNSEEFQIWLTALISDELIRYADNITRLEVHLSSEDGSKSRTNNIKCMIEARLEGKQPIAVANNSDTNEKAVHGAVEKLKSSLETKQGRLNNH